MQQQLFYLNKNNYYIKYLQKKKKKNYPIDIIL